ncbi:MAG TPA: universal stress protein [Candidatus Methanoperedens sp.]|nr:universal stress protein [Candidatus Methanoperedens sp.]
MKKILIPVDGSRGTKDIFAVCGSIVRPAEEVILLHVEQLGGKTLMLDMLGEAEMSTLRESIQGTSFKERLDAQAGTILRHCQAKLEGLGARNIRTLVREGVAAEEILKVAAEERVDLIVLGSNGGTALDQLISGSVTKDVERGAWVPVLVAKNSGCGEAALAWREAYAAR